MNVWQGASSQDAEPRSVFRNDRVARRILISDGEPFRKTVERDTAYPFFVALRAFHLNCRISFRIIEHEDAGSCRVRRADSNTAAF